MAEAWLNYADIAKALGTSPEAARQKAIRGRWRRQRGNDGRALVLVDLGAEQARTRPDDARTKRPDDARTVAALDAHIATLLGDIAKADALAEQRHGELVRGGPRAPRRHGRHGGRAGGPAGGYVAADGRGGSSSGQGARRVGSLSLAALVAAPCRLKATRGNVDEQAQFLAPRNMVRLSLSHCPTRTGGDHLSGT